MASRLMRACLYTDILLYLLVSGLMLGFYMDFSFFGVVGFIFIIAGFLVWLIGRSQLGNSFQITPVAKDLVTTGLYSRIRHPIYYGGLLVILGWMALTLGHKMSLAVILWGILTFFVIFFRVRAEEKILSKKFREKYKRYKGSSWF